VGSTRGSPADKEPAEPTVSIVLPTYNEEQIVETKLEDVLELDYPMEKVELVVVDSSTDDTRTIIREYIANLEAPELVLLEEDERRGLAPALNDAYAAASNEMVVKTDCDSNSLRTPFAKPPRISQTMTSQLLLVGTSRFSAVAKLNQVIAASRVIFSNSSPISIRH